MSQTTPSAILPRSDAAPAARVLPARKKSRRKWWILGSIVVVAALVVAAVLKSKQGVKPLMVTTDKAAIRTLTHLVTATGKVQPEIEVGIAPEVSGEIVALPLKEGAVVKKGDVIVRIKPDLYVALVDQQEAALASAKAASLLAKANQDKAEEDFRRADDLYQKKLISDADYTAAKTGMEVARANDQASLAVIRQMEGALNQSRDSLSKTTIYSPMDGIISVLNNEVGERVVGTGQFAGTEVMRIADLNHMEVRVKVNENDIVNVKLGDHAVVTIDAFPGRNFDGVVSEISSSALNTGATAAGNNQAALAASASDEVTNFLVRIRVTDREARLRPGMSGTVDIETETVNNVVSVPIQSVTVRAEGGKNTEELQQQRAKEAKERTGNDLELVKERQEARREREKLHQVVFIRQGDTVKMRPVETGIADNTYIEVKSGVKPGEEVVSGSYAAISRNLKDGAKVLVEKPKKDDKG
ncbi:MAG TPA: efflux RND transporter periplasmic adaptor subunit [Opitutaceae bacterium]|nr:efflux RND transporter periplasmic adaptor subunit [Opitutaceae bacterium]